MKTKANSKLTLGTVALLVRRRAAGKNGASLGWSCVWIAIFQQKFLSLIYFASLPRFPYYPFTFGVFGLLLTSEPSTGG